MTDLSGMSDAQLQALYQNPDPSTVASMVSSEAQRQGVDPALALRVAHQESGFNHATVSPKGAVGVMQLTPGTAGDLGVDPSDIDQNIQGGVTYLKQQVDRFGDPRLAAAAYNAGPSAVVQHGGVPPYPETQNYVNAVAGPDLSKMSNSDLMALYGQAGATPPTGPNFPAQAMTPTARPTAGTPAAQLPTQTPTPIAEAPLPPLGQPDATAAPSALDEALQGLWGPSQKLKGDFQDSYAKTTARATSFPSPLQAGADAVSDVGDTVRNIADAATLIPASVAGAFMRPLAAGIARITPTAYGDAAPTWTGGAPWSGGRLSLSAPQPLQGEAKVDMLQGALGTALSGARPMAPGAVPIAAPKPMTLDAVQASKKAAYAAVDQSGFTFPQADVQQLAQDVATEVARKGGPSGAKLYPAANAMADRLTALSNQPGGVPLTQLDELRSDIYGALVKPMDRESPIGVMMRQKIDGLINSANAPDIAAARDLNTRAMKMQAVSDKLDSADLRSASTYSGGNYSNAVRQNLRPLVDPTSGQQINNLTPAEATALRRAVTGTPAQNATRYVSKILGNKMLQAPAALMTHGAGPAVMEAVAGVLNKAGQSQTDGAVQRVLDLMSMGGVKPGSAAPVINAMALAGQPALSLFSPRGMIGGSVLARPMTQMPSAARGQ